MIILHVLVHVADDVLYHFIKLTKVNTERRSNAAAALELMAITATAPGQRLALARPVFTLSMQAYWNE